MMLPMAFGMRPVLTSPSTMALPLWIDMRSDVTPLYPTIIPAGVIVKSSCESQLYSCSRECSFGFDWTSAKAEDTFCPTGPGVTPAWFVDDPQDLRITLSVNGVVKQDSSTADMMNSAFAVVAAASRIMTLEPGDIVATGSPAGVGAPRGEFLQPGDDVVIEIEELGRLRNPVRAAGAGFDATRRIA